MTSAYIAAPYLCREAARECAKELRAAGIRITARWLFEDHDLSHEAAAADLEDIAVADVFVALNLPEWAERGTGGRHVEFGYALAIEKPILLIGDRTNVFHHHELVLLLEDGQSIPKTVISLAP